MSKIMLVGDIHAVSSISSRKDNVLDTIKTKLTAVVELAKKHKVNNVILLGDLFHVKVAHKVPHEAVSMYMTFLKEIGKYVDSVHTVVGNHDIYGNIKSIARQPIATLVRSGLCEFLPSSPIVLGDFEVSAVHYTEDIYENPLLAEKAWTTDKIKMICMHAYLFPDGEKFFEDFLNYKQLDEVYSDIVATGHYHTPKENITKYEGSISNKTFINPGSLLRGSSTSVNFERVPKVVIVESTNEGEFSSFVEEIPCVKASDIFREKKESKALSSEIKDFVDSIKQTATSEVSITTVDAIRLILKKHKVKKEVREYIAVELEKAEGK